MQVFSLPKANPPRPHKPMTRQSTGQAEPTPIVEAYEPPPQIGDGKFCHECGERIRRKAIVCPKCGCEQHRGKPGTTEPDDFRHTDAHGTRIACGICGILLGGIGLHKFVYGAIPAGIITVAIAIGTCGWGLIATIIIGFIEGIIYLCVSDEEFRQRYVIGKRGWF